MPFTISSISLKAVPELSLDEKRLKDGEVSNFTKRSGLYNRVVLVCIKIRYLSFPYCIQI